MKRIFYLFATLLFCVSLASFVLAHDEESDDDDKSKSEQKEMRKLDRAMERLERFELPEVESLGEHPTSLHIGPQGQTRIIRGEITSLAGTSTPAIDEIKVWGLVLKVDMTGANFIPSGTDKTKLAVGDKVNIKGTLDQTTGVIKASIVHSISARKRVADDILAQITKLIERLRELQQKAGLFLTPLPTPPTPTPTPATPSDQ